MKPERHARQDLAASVHYEGRDGGERDGDPALRAMRSVWLEMRDEDPPEGGLAELLAAARAHAETMQARPPRWQRLWQRSVAGLRRPGALALATVVVLLGGAVLLGRRGVDEPPAAMQAVAQTASAPGASDGISAPKAGSTGEQAVSSEASVKAELAVRRAVSSGAPGNAEPTIVVAGRHRAADPPVVTASQDTDRFADDEDEPRASPTHGAPAPPPRPAPSPAPPPPYASPGTLSSAPAREPAGASGDLAAAASSAHNESPPPADAGEAAKKLERADTTIATQDTQEAGSAAPLEQLYKECEAAARRGDCAAVRRMVGRITKTDRGYRARVAKGSPVAKCLAE